MGRRHEGWRRQSSGGPGEPDTIGEAVSSGCIRMMNQDVIDLYNRIPRGSKVVVLPA